MVQNLRPAVARGAKTKQTGRLATSAEKRKMSVVAKNTNPNAKQQKNGLRNWKILERRSFIITKIENAQQQNGEEGRKR